jgi:glycosyltransferase involved in cell wall biosynthesis
MNISLIICTKDRAQNLDETLRSLEGALRASSRKGELLVVDNGSRDKTPEVVRLRSVIGERWSIRYIAEPQGGQAVARNTGMAQSTEDVIAFTDDDVRFEPGWLDALVAPIVADAADAVVGRVELAPYLLRPWMSDLHKSWIASTCALDFKAPSRMVGANMAFSRSVLDKVPLFDADLGPGASGFADDTLFSHQLVAAGFRLRGAEDATVIHHCGVDRITVQAYISSAERMGKSSAFISHHWQHSRFDHVAARSFAKALPALWIAWRTKGKKFVSSDHLQLLQHQSFLSGLRNLQGEPRLYERQGLIRLSAR